MGWSGIFDQRQMQVWLHLFESVKFSSIIIMLFTIEFKKKYHDILPTIFLLKPSQNHQVSDKKKTPF